MRIIEIIPSLEPVGGAEVFVSNFCIEAIKHKNIKLKLIVFYKNNQASFLVNKLKKNDVDIIFLNRKNAFDFKFYKKLKETIKEFNPDVIHTHLMTTLSLHLVGLLNKKTKLKVFHTIHNSNPFSDAPSDKLLFKKIKNGIITPICVSESSKKIYEKELKKDILYINNGIKLEEFDSAKLLKDRKNDFLCVGRFVDVKNQSFVIDCIKTCNKLGNYNFTFIGNGCNFEKVKSEASACKNINFIKYEEKPSKYMCNSKVLIMPSLMEGNPMVINEAIASGMIVVANNVGGIPDVIKYKKEKYLTVVNDKGSFIKAMIDAVEEANHIDRFIYEQHILNSISITECVNNYLEVFKSL